LRKYFFIFTCISVSAWAQETVSYAGLSGRVLDPAGAVIEGASVMARQTETNQANSETTGHDGRFRFPYLRVGPYVVTVHKEGFADKATSVRLTVGAAFDLPFTLAVGEIQTQIEVNGALESARTQIATTISQTEVKDLPLSGRNYLDVALFVPGVSPTNTAANQLFAETSAIPGQGISIGSQRNFSNSFIIDGASANDDAAGVAGTFVGLDVVDEFQVVTSGGQAELGTSTWSRRAAATPCMGTLMGTSATAASTPPTLCRIQCFR
jgi:hypothetical protein